MRLAACIRQARVARGLTQRDLAAKMRISHVAIANWETERARPSLENRARLAKVLGIDIGALIPEFRRVKAGGSLAAMEIASAAPTE